jgi:hypothetical protein
VLLPEGCLPCMSSLYWLLYYQMRKESSESKGRG